MENKEMTLNELQIMLGYYSRKISGVTAKVDAIYQKANLEQSELQRSNIKDSKVLEKKNKEIIERVNKEAKEIDKEAQPFRDNFKIVETQIALITEKYINSLLKS